LLFLGLEKNYNIFVEVNGGGLSGQADAILCIFYYYLYRVVLLYEIDFI